MRRFLTVCVLMILLSQPVYTQLHPYKHFKVSDGLASQNVFDCIEDSNGYMWFATMDGLSRFDGYNFKNYYQRDGLNSNYINKIIQGPDGLYVSNYTKGVNKIKNGIFKNIIDYDYSLHQILIHNDELYLVHSTNINKFNGEDLTEIYRNWYQKEFNVSYTILYFGDIIVATEKGLYCIKDDKLIKYEVVGIKDIHLYYLATDKYNNLYASGENKIYKIKDNKVVREYKFNFKKGEDKIFKMIVDKNENIWFSVMNSGLFRYDMKEDILTNTSSKLGFKQFHVNEIYEDSKGDIWVCTFGRGVYLFYDTYISNYTERDGLSHYYVNAISGNDDGKILIGTYDKLSVLEKNEFINIEIPSPSHTTYIYDIAKNSNDNFLVNTSTFNNTILSQQHGNMNFKIFLSSSSALYNEDSIVVGTWENFFLFIENKVSDIRIGPSVFDIIYIYGNDYLPNRINDIYIDEDKKIWFASNYGVSFYKDKTVTILNDTLMKGRFLSIKEDKDGILYAAGENGLFKISDTTVTETLLRNITVSSVEFDNKDRIWAGSNKGLYMFDRFPDYKSSSFLNEKSGLTSDDIKSLYYNPTDNHLWIGTTNGVTSLDLSAFDAKSGETISLSVLNISSGDSNYLMNDTIFFTSDVEEISITVSSFEYGSVDGIVYEYSLDESTWFTSASNVIKFNLLPSGNYNLNLRARDNLGNVSEASLINFEIETPFENSTLFYILLASFVFSSTGFFIYKRGKRKLLLEKERSSFRDQISTLKQKSLSAMLNPHFIFNSLNSIQSFYNYDEKENVNEYIAKLSRLIRMNLDFADKTFIKLSEELDRLENYIQLEKMRFEEKLDYEIWVSNDIDPEKTSIPNMIIQPFVENSIWHGILKSDRNGFLTINIFHAMLPDEIRKDYKVQYHTSLETNPEEITSYPDRCLKIEISDNGIGLKKAACNKKSNHTSLGIKVIRERLSILHHYAGEIELVSISDRSDTNPAETGTLVEIYLTPNIYKSKK